MSKCIKFKVEYQKGTRLLKYPDDISLFENTVSDGKFIHAIYHGKKKLDASYLFAEQLLPVKIQQVKDVAFQLISAVDGVGGWKRQRANDKLRFENDESYLKALYSEAEAIRVKSNQIEETISKIDDYFELADFDVAAAFSE